MVIQRIGQCSLKYLHLGTQGEHTVWCRNKQGPWGLPGMGQANVHTECLNPAESTTISLERERPEQ